MALKKNPPAPAPWENNFGEKKRCGEHAQPSLATRVGGGEERQPAFLPVHTLFVRDYLLKPEAQAQIDSC